MKNLFLGLFFLGVVTQGHSAKIGQEEVNPSEIRIVSVTPTPEGDNIQTIIQFPKLNQITSGSPLNVQILLRGYPLGIPSSFDRSNEIFNDPNGQSLIVIIDNEHPIEIYKSFVDALNPSNLFFDLTLNTEVDFPLSRGMHVIRAFPDRSYGESLKSGSAFAASVFYVNEQTNNLNVNLNGPYLTYNEPLETMPYQSEKPILLDFYLSNTQLSTDGYKVLVTIDGNVIRSLTRWVPYYIYGLSKGVHAIRLQLLDEKNRPVPGLFNDVTRNVTVD